MKILIATSTFEPDIGGMQKYAKNIANFLAQKNGVSLITYSTKWSFSDDKKRAYKIVRIWRKN